MGMDKNVATAIVLERCNCYDSSLEAAKKALMSGDLPHDQIQAAKEVIISLGNFYLNQQCLEKIMECCRLLEKHPTEPDQEVHDLEATIPRDLFELFKATQAVPENQTKTIHQLIAEALTLLVLEYAQQPEVKKKILENAESRFAKYSSSSE
ncbi:hypothetical protein [Desulfonatronovibrio hydrogenovorans]|uniref:hypothetical protein n=1 Tax=Desulfonatronovibrio hydrogenovorans TaxID=53245 RepID=UPI00048E3D97|nr:hypothetical protein [Desulfonatronovibrio hydrogenovorans]